MCWYNVNKNILLPVIPKIRVGTSCKADFLKMSVLGKHKRRCKLRRKIQLSQTVNACMVYMVHTISCLNFAADFKWFVVLSTTLSPYRMIGEELSVPGALSKS